MGPETGHSTHIVFGLQVGYRIELSIQDVVFDLIDGTSAPGVLAVWSRIF